MRGRRGIWLLSSESLKNGFETRAIGFGYGEEFEAEAATALYVTNDRVSLDAAFLDQKIELSGCAFFHGCVRSLNEEAVHADVQNAGNII